MKMSSISWLQCLCGLIWVFLISCGSLPGTGRGELAPDFKLVDLEGKPQQLSQYRGKVVLLHFWTDWCNACRAEFPRIQEYYAELKGENFELIAVNVGQPAAVSQTFRQDFKVTFPMWLDAQKAVADMYKVEGYPTNYFINPEGKIIKKYLGWVSRRQVEVIIKQHQQTPAAGAKK